MVRFCKKCKRAVDDLDKFCRECGNNTCDSIDYHTYYNCFLFEGSSYAEEEISGQEKEKIPISGQVKKEISVSDDVEQSRYELENNIVAKEEISPPEIKEEMSPPEIKEEMSPPEIKEEMSPPEIKEEIPPPEIKEEIPHEVEDKLGPLLSIEDIGQKEAIQYLINKYSKVSGKDIKDKNILESHAGITLIPKEDVVRIGRIREKEPYEEYEIAIHRFISDILEKINNSKEGMIRIRLADIARQMGEKFIDKKTVTLYYGLKYSLFKHKIVVEMGTLEDVDPTTGTCIKVLIMRMKNPGDKLPPSLIKEIKVNS